MNKIKLYVDNSSVQIEGGEGCFYRFHFESGSLLATGIFDYWYRGFAYDDNGFEYRIIWNLKSDFFNEDGSLNELFYLVDESDLCDWEDPAEVFCENTQKAVELYELI